MIQQQKDYSQPHQLTPLLLFNNAIYQGKYCPARKHPNGNGLVYFPQSKRVIVCSKFKDGEISNQALVYHSRQKYLYGRWKSSKLDGVALLRKADTVLVAYFSAGEISKQSKAVLLVNEYQLGLLLRFRDGEWQTLQRTEIYCKQHILQLFRKCGLGDYSMPLSLVSFLNEEIAVTPAQLGKLRFVNNRYEYGFEGGLHLIFSQGQQLTGLKFANQNIVNLGDIRSEDQDKRLNALLRRSIERQRTAQVGTIYKQKQHNNQYIFSKDFEDPSPQYFAYLQTTFNQALLKQLRAGLFRPSKTKHIQQFHLHLFPVNNTSIQPTNQAVQTSLQESSIEAIDEQQQSEEYSWQRSIAERQGAIETASFQMLPQESRLNIIKQQQKEFLHSKVLRQKHSLRQSRKNQIEESQRFMQKVEQYQNRQQYQNKQSQTNVVILTSPVANKQSSPLTSKRKRARIFNSQSPLRTHTPNKHTDIKTTYIQSELKPNRKLQVEMKGDEVQLGGSLKKQGILFHQLESRIAEEVESDSNDVISVKDINCSPTKFKNKQFSLANIDILPTNIDILPTNIDILPSNIDILPSNIDILPSNIDILPTPQLSKDSKQTNQSTAVIDPHQTKQPKEQHTSAERHFVAIAKPKHKSPKSSRRYDSEGLSDKKLLFDYIMI